MLTWLRRILFCFCLELCILFAALWVRSYYHRDMLIVTSPGPTLSASWRGIIQVLGDDSDLRIRKTVWRWISSPIVQVGPAPRWVKYGFGWQTSPHRVVFPHWFLVLTTALLAIAIRPQPRWRYGTRDLFTLSTVAAVTVGLLAIVLKAIA